MSIQTVAVVGSGFMGSGIAQVCAQSGFPVCLVDIDEQRLAHAQKSIRWSVEKLVSKGVVADAVDEVLGRVSTARHLEAAAEADLAIEAVYEQIALKQEVFAQLHHLCKAEAILASNTSTIPIAKLAQATKRPDRVIGMHFFGPVPLMRLLEITPNPRTDEAVTQSIVDFAYAVGKNPILVRQDIPGFLMNRIFGAMACEAIRLVERGAGSIEEIDQGMCDGFNMRVGPLCIADLAGLDISLNAFNVMHGLDPEYLPKAPALLERLVREGHLGAKSGQGFYIWDENGKRRGPAF
ncbi:MAG: 3-hydroxyacyl-CoA dehydrogenase family protein [Candidatus Hydrogenedentes bacterium]|nr:3-hydroxyacyl-CoA dehydrogenase family protein [Candidatus Hydrogenedentota bacterium]